MGSRKRMLVADSEEISRILAKNIFINDYEITEAENGKQVLELLKCNRFNVLLLDDQLKDIDGIELLRLIKKDSDWSTIPVVIIFEKENIEKQLQVLELGADDYFIKPYDLQILQFRINNLVKKNELMRNEYENDLYEAKNDLKILTDTIKDGIAELLIKDKVILKKCNQEFCSLLGYSMSELMNNANFTKLIRKSDINRFYNIVNRAKENQHVFCTEICFIKKSGITVRLGLSLNYIRKDEETDADHYYVLFSDRTQQRKVKEQFRDMMDHLLYQAEKDKLTGIYNKEAFMEKAEDRLKRSDTDYIIAVIRIDGYKIIHALYGREMAQKVLSECANHIAEKMNRLGLYGRLEQDQFACILPKNVVTDNLSTIEYMLATGFSIAGIDYPVTLHVGFYEVTDSKKSVESMCNMALIAANSIKNNYIIRWKLFDNKLKKELTEEQELVCDMEKAIKNRQFILHLQPVYDTNTGKIIFAEALVRWKHPKKGIIGPQIFIPLFERNGFITKLDLYVWELVLQFLADNRQKKIHNVPISVNISSISCYNKFLVQDFEDLVDKYEIDRSLIRLEISQKAFMNEPEQLLDTVRRFQEKGYVIVMDNYGTENASLNVLRDVPLDYLKIDMKFLEEIEKSEKASYIISNVVDIAKKLHIQVIAERVETKNQYDYLGGIDCEIMQGYFFTRPVETDEFLTRYSDALDQDLEIPKRKTHVKDAKTLKKQWFDVLDSEVIAVARIKIDLQDPKMHGKYLYANNYYLKIHGLNEQDLQIEETDIYQNFVEEDEVQSRRAFRQTLITGNKFIQNICNLRLSTGKIVTVLIVGNVYYEANGMVQINIMEVPVWSENENMMVKIIDNVLDDLLTHTKVYCWRYDIINNAYVYKSGQIKNNGMPNYIQGADEKFLPGHCFLKEDYSRVHEMYDKIRHGEPLLEEIFHMYLMDNPEQFVWIKIIYKTIFNHNNEPIMAIGIAENITVDKDIEQYKENEKITSAMLKEAEKQISLLNSLAVEARMDIMTGCMNRSYFEQAVCEYGDLHNDDLHAFYMLDIDNFKTVNDTLGHDVGDLVLKTLSQQVMRILGVGNLFGRIGGDEFAALVITADNTAVIEKFAQDICSTISMHLEKAGKRVFVSCSLGICIASKGRYEFNELYTGADAALYRAKNAGKNQYQIIYL